tara:strand:+ start:30 stop:524 length:495 start_codon:yes stop_codon:yes gene_type:complete
VVSTLKLTKIQIPNSDSDVISLDASTGNITLNKTLGGTSITVQGEGTATTNLQQGLVKAWYEADGAIGTPAIQDGFNYSTITDVSTGRYTMSVTSNWANTNYSESFQQKIDRGAAAEYNFYGISASSGAVDIKTTSQCQHYSSDQPTSAEDHSRAGSVSCGELA